MIVEVKLKRVRNRSRKENARNDGDNDTNFKLYIIMALPFDYRNNVIVNLNAAVAAWVTSISVDPATEALLPNWPQNTIATLEEVDLSTWAITLREGILITNRAANILTVTRAYQEMPADDTATTHTQISYAFDPVNNARIGLYWTKAHGEELNKIPNDYLTKSDYVDSALLGGTTATWTDAYQISSAEVSAYVDNQRFFVTFDVSNSWSATFEINWLGAKPLEKLDGQTLATWDITANFSSVVMYNAIDDSFILLTVADPSSGLVVDNLRKTFELGQDMTAGDNLGASFVWCWTTPYVNNWVSNLLLGNVAANQERYLHIDEESSINLSEYTLRIRTVGSPVDNVVVTYRDTYWVVANEVISAGSMSGAYTTFTFNKYNEVKFRRKDTTSPTQGNKILAISRDGWLDPANYYEIEWLAWWTPIANTYQALGLVWATSVTEWREMWRLKVTDIWLFDIAFQIRNSWTTLSRNPQLQVWIWKDTTTWTLIFDQTYPWSNYWGWAGFQSFSFLGEMVANQDVFVRTRNTSSAQTLAIQFQNFIINNGVIEDKPNTNAIVWYDIDKMFLSDNRDIETNIANGVLVSTGLRTEGRDFVMEWVLNNSANTPCEDLFLNGWAGEYWPTKTWNVWFFQLAKQLESNTVYVGWPSKLSWWIEKQPLIMRLGWQTTNYYRANQAAYEIASTFVFPGSDTVWVPKSIKLICSMNGAGEEGAFRVVDQNTWLTIWEKLTWDIGTIWSPVLIDLWYIQNVWKTETIWTLEGREVWWASNFDMHSLIIYY